jgi:hypothetical protein
MSSGWSIITNGAREFSGRLVSGVTRHYNYRKYIISKKIKYLY